MLHPGLGVQYSINQINFILLHLNQMLYYTPCLSCHVTPTPILLINASIIYVYIAIQARIDVFLNAS